MVAPVKNGNAHRSNGGKPYGLMVLLALLAAIIGVTVLHKLREGRLSSVLVKEKEHDLISLHLLLQKERRVNEEAKKKLEEMETNMHSLSAQRSDVEGRLSEVNSLVSSLKDEMKTLESQLEEKQSEINTLKQQQQMTPNANDDPSIPPNNSTISGSEVVFPDKNGADSSNENENTKLENSVEEAKSSMTPSNVSEVEASTEKVTADDNGNGKASAIRVKSKQRRLKRRRYKDLITRFMEGNNSHQEQNEVGSSTKKTNTEEAAEQTGQSTGTKTKKEEYVALRTEEPENMAEMKEVKDSSAGKVEANKDVESETGHFEDKEETKSNKDEEQKAN